MAQTYMWTAIPCIPEVGPLEVFFNFWRIFESCKIDIFGYFLMFLRETLHMVQRIDMKRATDMYVDSSSLHTRNGTPGIIF